MIKRVLLSWFFATAVLIAHPIDIKLSSQTIGLGQPIKVTITTKHVIKQHKILFLGQSFNLFLAEKKKSRRVYEAYIAAGRKTKPGEYVLVVDLTTKKKHTFYEHYKVTLDYPSSPKKGSVGLTKKAKKISKKIRSYSQEGALLTQRFKTLTQKKYFDGPFIMPAQGRISSEFATLRTYNNGRTSSHAGVDIANKKGSIIVAPAAGKVILSETLTIHGDTIMIDHGFGLVSVFCHLDTRQVKEGKKVGKGTQIGTMGMTGVVSGVHLHWGLSVQNIRVNPLFFLGHKAKLF